VAGRMWDFMCEKGEAEKGKIGKKMVKSKLNG
jgi:hypothetical protein